MISPNDDLTYSIIKGIDREITKLGDTFGFAEAALSTTEYSERIDDRLFGTNEKFSCYTTLTGATAKTYFNNYIDNYPLIFCTSKMSEKFDLPAIYQVGGTLQNDTISTEGHATQVYIKTNEGGVGWFKNVNKIHVFQLNEGHKIFNMNGSVQTLGEYFIVAADPHRVSRSQLSVALAACSS